MTEQPQPTPPPGERPVWRLDRDQQRVLFITFVGGVASIVVAAVIVGIAIALAHTIIPDLKKTSPVAIDALTLAVTILSVLPLIATFALAARKKPGSPLTFILRRVALVALGIVSAAGILAALTLVGAAAGVH